MESFISGYDPDLWDVVLDGYKHPVDAKGNKIDRKSMEKQQNIDYKNHHKARSILLSAIS